MRRTLAVATMLASLLWIGARPASADPWFELVWGATTGAGTPGIDEIGADPGDLLSVDIFVHVDGDGLLFAGISLDFTTGALTNPAIHACPTGCQGMTAYPATVLPGSIQHLRVFEPPTPGPIDILLARIDFTATGEPGSIDPFFVFEVDGTLTASAQSNLSPLANPVRVVGPVPVPALPGPTPLLLLAFALAMSARASLARRGRRVSARRCRAVIRPRRADRVSERGPGLPAAG